PSVGMDTRRGAARGEAKAVESDRHTAGVGKLHLAVRRDDERGARKPHRTDADVVAQRGQLVLERRDRRVGVPAADRAQARRLLPETHAGVLRAADAEADDRGLARQAALAELHERVDEEALDAGDAVGWEQHPVVAPEEPALVNGRDVDPVAA